MEVDYEKMTLNELLFYVADPFDTHMGLNGEEYELINEVISEKMNEGRKFLEKIFESQFKKSARVTKEKPIENAYELFNVMMSAIPKGHRARCIEAYNEYERKNKKKEKKPPMDRLSFAGEGIIRSEEGRINKKLYENYKIREAYLFTQNMYDETQVVLRRVKAEERIKEKILYKIIRECSNANEIIRIVKTCNRIDDIFGKIKKNEKLKYLLIGSGLVEDLFHKAKENRIESIFNRNDVCVDDILGIKVVAPGYELYRKIEKNFTENYSQYYLLKKETDNPLEKYSERVVQTKWQYSTKDKPDTKIQVIFKTLTDELCDEFFSKDNHFLFSNRRKDKIDEIIEESKNRKELYKMRDAVEGRLSRLVI
jgi:hypothetical protein